MNIHICNMKLVLAILLSSITTTSAQLECCRMCGPNGITISIAGSTNVQEVAEAWAIAYRAQCPGVTVNIEGGGSSVGARRVCGNLSSGTPVDVGLLFREWLSTEATVINASQEKYQCNNGVPPRTVTQIDVGFNVNFNSPLHMNILDTSIASTGPFICYGLSPAGIISVENLGHDPPPAAELPTILARIGLKQCQPSSAPTRRPTQTPITKPPTLRPTSMPTKAPSRRPTQIPTTKLPTSRPTNKPTKAPTSQPTKVPTTATPTYLPTTDPTQAPTSCGLLGLSIFCPFTFCGLIGRLLGLC